MGHNPHSGFTIATESIAAAGTNQATATELVATVLNIVSGADATKAVRLPAVAQRLCLVQNIAAAALPVYPHVGGDINDGSADAAVTLAAKSLALFVAVDGVTWGATYTASE